MSRLRRLVDITPGERWLLAEACLVLWGVRLSLWFLPFSVSLPNRHEIERIDITQVKSGRSAGAEKSHVFADAQCLLPRFQLG